MPGFDTVEHRFGFALGYVAAVHSGVAASLGRMDYTLGWQGWGAGVTIALDFGQSGVVSDPSVELGLLGFALRRYLLLRDVRVWAGAELGIAYLSRGSSGEAEAVLYHGTSSALELGADFGRHRDWRPFVSVRADLPWFRTEFETLTPAPSGSPEGGITLIDNWQRWTPVFGVWGGIAL